MSFSFRAPFLGIWLIPSFASRCHTCKYYFLRIFLFPIRSFCLSLSITRFVVHYFLILFFFALHFFKYFLVIPLSKITSLWHFNGFGAFFVLPLFGQSSAARIRSSKKTVFSSSFILVFLSVYTISHLSLRRFRLDLFLFHCGARGDIERQILRIGL